MSRKAATLKTDRYAAVVDHKYRLLDGTVAINVTAISDLLDNGKSGAFAGAATKLLREGKNYREEWKAKAERGTRVHGHMEKWLRGEDIQVAPDEEGYVDGLEKFLGDHQPEWLEMERIALSALGYGGRFDLITRLVDGLTWLIDLKTGKPYPVEHALQLSAYRYADGMAEYDEEGHLCPVLQPLPHIDKAGCLYVQEDGTYKLVEYPANEVTFTMFTRLLEVYQWTRTDEIKALVKAAKPPRKPPTRRSTT